MRKEYPYLHDNYFTNTETEENVSSSVLLDIQKFANQRQYVRMTLLTWEENPIRDIEGEVVSGSISKVATSPVRRTAELSISVNSGSYDMNDAKADFAINKKIYIELGVKNDTNKYPDYPIFWFPQGIFFIGSFSINSSAAGATNINISLKDKMAMLNGDVGGTLPATVTFDQVDTQLPDGSYATQKVTYYRIIQELVSHFGKESLSNIVIEDVPLRIRRIMQWTGANPLYLIWEPDTKEGKYTPIFSLEKPNEVNGYAYDIYYTGENVGYVRDNFVPVDELVGAAGETVMSILDKIVQSLGNYEYFYDVYGIFHFREIKNYLNNSLGSVALEKLSEKEYLTEINNEKSVFTFSDKTLLSSITVTPLYENIKNDFIIEGLAENETTGISHPVRYHLAIDKKPTLLNEKDGRPEIVTLRDRTEDIKKVNNDIEMLQLKIDLEQNDINQAATRIRSLEKQKEQRYSQRKKYGDELKYQLQQTFGEWAIPNNQVLSSLSGKNKLTEEDFYSDQLDNLKNSLVNMQENSSEYLTESDELLTTIVSRVLGTNFKNIENYSHIIYEYLTPEGYWKLIKSKVLQTEYDNKKEEEFKTAQFRWQAARSNVILGSEADFNALSSGTQNSDTGYKKINNTVILTNEKEYITKPKTELSIADIWNNFDIGLNDLCGTYKKSYIQKIYTQYSSYLYNNSFQNQEEANKKEFLIMIFNLKAQKTALEYLKDKWNDANVSSKIWYKGKWDSDNNKVVQDTSDTAKVTISKSSYSYTKLEGKIKNLTDQISCYNTCLTAVNTNLSTLQSKISDKKLGNAEGSIFYNLHKCYVNYIEEQTIIQNLEDSKITWKNLKAGSFFKNLTEVNSFIGKLESSQCKLTSEKDTIGGHIEGNSKKDYNLVRPSIYPSSNGSRPSGIKNKIYWYNQWIKKLTSIIQNWEKNPGKTTKPNPHYHQRYYAKYNDKTLILYREGDTGLIKAGFVNTIEKFTDDLKTQITYEEEIASDVGNFNLFYSDGQGGYCYWDGQMYKPLDVKAVYPRQNSEDTNDDNCYYVYDWRTLLYLEGKYAQIYGLDEGHYFQELDAYWPQTYDLINQWFYGQSLDNDNSYNPSKVTQGVYFLDFLDSVDSKFGEWSVNNIGRRSDIISNNKINCLFEAEIPNINILNATHLSTSSNSKSLEQEMSLGDLKKESSLNDEPWTQVEDEIFDHLVTGGYQNGAYEQIKYELYSHTTYQKSISLSAIPVFYLEPNSRVKIVDDSTKTYGDFILQSIGLTLGPGATMSISASEATERF